MSFAASLLVLWHRTVCKRHLGLLMAALLFACSTPIVPRYYVLSPLQLVADTPTAASRRLSVAIRDLQLPQYLERPQLVLRGGDHRIQLVEDAQWAGNLQQDMVRVLLENLGYFLGSDRVFSSPNSATFKPDFKIDIDILRFERDSTGRVLLVARWWLLRGNDGALLETQIVRLAGDPLASRSNESLVASMSAVYGDFARAVANSVNQFKSVSPSP